jgi:ElaB/YqjD/DUF883 family membrane-anchored ribosome-binding protein
MASTTNTQKNSVTKHINTALNGSEPGADDIKRDIEALRSDLKGLVETVSQIAANKASEGIETSKEMISTTSTKAQELQGNLENKVRANPLASIGIALGAGMLLATLRRR